MTNRPSVSEASPIQDELQLSDAGPLVDKVRDLPEIRQDRVDQIRAQIADGTYESEEKLEIAVGRLLDEIG
jgi:negative regulator of flagellin synthesis FlgM